MANTITGPDGRVFHLSELPTGIASHVKLLVREYEAFNDELRRMIRNCKDTRKDLEERGSGRQVDLRPILSPFWATLGNLESRLPKTGHGLGFD